MGFWEKVVMVVASPILLPVGIGLAIADAIRGDSAEAQAAAARDSEEKARADAQLKADEQEKVAILQYAHRELIAAMGRHGLTSKAGLEAMDMDQLTLAATAPVVSLSMMYRLRCLSPNLCETAEGVEKSEHARLKQEIDELTRLRLALSLETVLDNTKGSRA